MRMKKGLYLSVAVIATAAFLAGSPVRVNAQQAPRSRSGLPISAASCAGQWAGSGRMGYCGNH